jgi:hypothetical protein
MEKMPLALSLFLNELKEIYSPLPNSGEGQRVRVRAGCESVRLISCTFLFLKAYPHALRGGE